MSENEDAAESLQEIFHWQGQLYNGLSLTPLAPCTLPLHHFLMSPCYRTAASGPKSTPAFP